MSVRNAYPSVAHASLLTFLIGLGALLPLYVGALLIAGTPRAALALLPTWIMSAGLVTFTVSWALHDRTPWKPSEQLAADSDRYQTLFERSPVPLWLIDYSALQQQIELFRPCLASGNHVHYLKRHQGVLQRLARSIHILDINLAAQELFEAGTADILVRRRGEIFCADGYATIIAFLDSLLQKKMHAQWEGDLLTLGGKSRHLNIRWEVFPKGQQILIAMIDSSDQEVARQTMASTVNEREVLLRELYHRTKNNMQSVLSLISFETWKVEDPAFRAILKSLETRVYSMSLVHRMLYEYKDLSRLSLSAYLREFASYLSISEQLESRGIAFELKLEEMEVTIDVAVPLGLVVSELIANALTHAFPSGRGGIIMVELHTIDEHHFVLEVSDNGVGVKESFNPGEDGALGIQLVLSLAESQLGGEASFSPAPTGGLRCRVLVRPDLYEIRV